ncbi:MAG: preprotein translocase subunit SecA [Phycisphaerales bacterium]
MGVPVIGSTLKKIFGSRNDRVVKSYLRVVDDVNRHEPAIRQLTDAELRDKTGEFREKLSGGGSLDALTPEIFAVAREAMDRAVGIRAIFNPEHNFDPSVLPASVQGMYAETKAAMDAAEVMPPTGEFNGHSEEIHGWQYLDIPNAIYEAVRELHPVSKPPFRSRPFDVQIIGAIVLSEGRIAEMKTGEGKTIVAPLAAYRAALQDRKVHVVTVNDYLVQRDRDWTFPFFRSVGMTVGAIHPMHMQPPQLKQLAYQCDVVYGTTSEFGFDYLRDNMKLSPAEQMPTARDFAIVDEVDSTLIDEARTPLIISGPAHRTTPRYEMADELARHLVNKQRDWADADARVQEALVQISSLEGDIRNARDKDRVPQLKSELDSARGSLPGLEEARDRYIQFYEVEMDKKKATLTHEGIEEAQRKSGIGSFYVGDNIDLPHLLEQAVRGHTVYQRDRDYVVSPDDQGEMSVIIVDQNTGRKMIGRQWSDGLHQAVEAKEKVKIKEETQTMATITIQNFFKLYDRLSGMTGTADTEATEFHEIYSMDVVVIPTNVAIARLDHNDLVFMSERDKWEAIVAEIERFWRVGRPVLVGTTSVEKSELLSEMLTKHGNIPHEVLNARQHEREADIVMNAGQLGSVVVATNMAGRGTDIKLAKFTTQELVDHWKRTGLAGRDVDGSMEEADIIARVYRHMAGRALGIKGKDLEALSDDDIRMRLLQHWVVEIAMADATKAAGMSREQLEGLLDDSGSMLLHRLRIYDNCMDLGGLHVVATERHESRRVDNQLRGRSGRQGDNGSSRFFLSLEDDLMKMFAGKATLGLLSKLGMKEGDVIEHPMLTRSVGKAQRKVEERNFLIRKNILEYDEVMDHQRHEFYGMRQRVLEGKGVKELIFEHIEDSVADAAHMYLAPDYVGTCIAEWVEKNLGVMVEADRFRKKDREDLRDFIAVETKEEASSMIRLAMGEFMPDEVDQPDWDLKSLAEWASSEFDGTVHVSDLLDRSRREIFSHVEEVAHEQIDEADLDPVDEFMVDIYGAKKLSTWCQDMFQTDIDPEVLADFEDIDNAVDAIMEKARDAYRRREIEYPVEFAMEMTGNGLSQAARAETPEQAQEVQRQVIGQFCDWARGRYELDWTPESLPTTQSAELAQLLMKEAATWDAAKIKARANKAVAAAGGDVEALDAWFGEHCNARLTEDERTDAAEDMQAAAEEKVGSILRAELTQFERWVLLQIVDQAWKDHLYAIDQLRESIGYRSFSQKDPRIEFKREGARLYADMEEGIRDKVTEIVFKGRLTAQAAPAGAPARSRPEDAPAGGGNGNGGGGGGGAAVAAGVAGGAAAAGGPPRPVQPAQPATAAAVAASAQQREALEAADQAGVPEGERNSKPKPVKSMATIGRNEPCPCGSGQKYKKCCGA